VTYQEATQHLLREKLQLVYLIYGGEPYFSEKCLEIIKRRLLKPETIDFSFDQFFVDETAAAEIVGAAQTATLLVPQRLVVVRRVQQLKQKGLKQILAYAASPSPTAVMALMGDKLEGKSAWIKEIRKYAKEIRFYPLYPNQAAAWIRTKVQQAGYQIAYEAAQALVENSGTALFQLEQELYKIFSYLGRPGRITTREVDLLTSHGKEHTVFELVDAIGEKNAKLALQKLFALLSAGEHPLFILALIARQFRLLYQARELYTQGCPGADIGKRLGLRGKSSQKIVSQAKKFSETEIKSAFQTLYKADLQLKTTAVPPRQVLVSSVIGFIPPA